ncbi:integrin alpha n-terminal [Fusarium acutatum]|uniref:Integrin alpha n-terminal n=1 Tax=Fusarium acutatum TaxID=78861 RepID=A0A8H4NJQ8_9HYPO|nr:integrin alpha n-terminal [Fusarium acutatum]
MNVNTVLNLAVPALAFLGGVAGVPSGQYYSYDLELKETNFAPNHADLQARQSEKTALRIMPLGASIWLVDMVGSKQNGNMTDRDFEATPGYTIDQVRKAASNSYGYKPNAELHHNDDDAKKALAARVAMLDYLIPDGYGRVFHPQIPLHGMIASLVVCEIMKDYQARIGYPVWTPPPENTSCKVKPSPTPSAPPKPPPPPTHPTLIPLPPFEPKYDCKGSKLCGSPLLRLKDRDHAVDLNILQRRTTLMETVGANLTGLAAASFLKRINIGWRMGAGESYIMMYWTWWEQQKEQLDEKQRIEYFRRWPPPPEWLIWMIEIIWDLDPKDFEDEDDYSPYFRRTETLGFGSEDDYKNAIRDEEE